MKQGRFLPRLEWALVGFFVLAVWPAEEHRRSGRSSVVTAFTTSHSRYGYPRVSGSYRFTSPSVLQQQQQQQQSSYGNVDGNADNNRIADAWRQMDQDMCNNDDEALDILMEIRNSFRQLVDHAERKESSIQQQQPKQQEVSAPTPSFVNQQAVVSPQGTTQQIAVVQDDSKILDPQELSGREALPVSEIARESLPPLPQTSSQEERSTEASEDIANVEWNFPGQRQGNQASQAFFPRQSSLYKTTSRSQSHPVTAAFAGWKTTHWTSRANSSTALLYKWGNSSAVDFLDHFNTGSNETTQSVSTHSSSIKDETIKINPSLQSMHTAFSNESWSIPTRDIQEMYNTTKSEISTQVSSSAASMETPSMSEWTEEKPDTFQEPLKKATTFLDTLFITYSVQDYWRDFAVSRRKALVDSEIPFSGVMAAPSMESLLFPGTFLDALCITSLYVKEVYNVQATRETSDSQLSNTDNPSTDPFYIPATFLDALCISLFVEELQNIATDTDVPTSTSTTPPPSSMPATPLDPLVIPGSLPKGFGISSLYVDDRYKLWGVPTIVKAASNMPSLDAHDNGSDEPAILSHDSVEVVREVASRTDALRPEDGQDTIKAVTWSNVVAVARKPFQPKNADSARRVSLKSNSSSLMELPEISNKSVPVSDSIVLDKTNKTVAAVKDSGPKATSTATTIQSSIEVKQALQASRLRSKVNSTADNKRSSVEEKQAVQVSTSTSKVDSTATTKISSIEEKQAVQSSISTSKVNSTTANAKKSSVQEKRAVQASISTSKAKSRTTTKERSVQEKRSLQASISTSKADSKPTTKKPSVEEKQAVQASVSTSKANSTAITKKPFVEAKGTVQSSISTSKADSTAMTKKPSVQEKRTVQASISTSKVEKPFFARPKKASIRAVYAPNKSSSKLQKPSSSAVHSKQNSTNLRSNPDVAKMSVKSSSVVDSVHKPGKVSRTKVKDFKSDRKKVTSMKAQAKPKGFAKTVVRPREADPQRKASSISLTTQTKAKESPVSAKVAGTSTSSPAQFKLETDGSTPLPTNSNSSLSSEGDETNAKLEELFPELQTLEALRSNVTEAFDRQRELDLEAKGQKQRQPKKKKGKLLSLDIVYHPSSQLTGKVIPPKIVRERQLQQQKHHVNHHARRQILPAFHRRSR